MSFLRSTLSDRWLSGLLIANGVVSAVHDVSDGGLLVAVTEMALASGIGATLQPLDTTVAFGEGQGRYIVTVADAKVLESLGVAMTSVGKTGGDAVVLNGSSIALCDLRAAHESFFKDWMED